MEIELLLPRVGTIPLADLSGFCREGALAEPFNPCIKDICTRLSQLIMHDPEARQYPELLTVAFWIRKAEISRLEQEFRLMEKEGRFLVPRGLCFHVPPRNVDTMFVYSWLLAALTGNRNVIRLSRSRSESTEVLRRLFAKAIEDAPEAVRETAVIVSYDHEEEFTRYLSSICDVRVIWGGDQTVSSIRRFPLPPLARELTFPDRYSASAIRVEAYLDLDESQKSSLIKRFFNDAFWFDQLACSSPRLVIWCGAESAFKLASRDFFRRLNDYCLVREFPIAPATVAKRLVFACSAILDLPVSAMQRYPALIVLTIDSLRDFDRRHPGGGFFFECAVNDLSEVAAFLRRRDQTLTYFGFDRDEINSLVRRLNGAGIDRIVPVGSALQFGRFWDGNDLLQEFCRTIHLVANHADA